MATVCEADTGRLITLDAHTLIGRGSHCNLRLTDNVVSSDHACIKWTGTQWVLRDLNSTNGTWLGRDLIQKGHDLELTVGAELGFGSQKIGWTVVDLHPPEPMASPVQGGASCPLLEGVISIPDAKQPAASIFQGVEGTWTLEVGDSVRTIAPGTLLEASGTSWRFSCPTQWQATTPLHSVRLLDASRLVFEVSSDEEQVSLTIDTGREMVRLGESNTFYLLLTLARLRLQDARRPAAETGWVHREQLVKMLRCDPQLLNVWVCRIRSKLSSAGFIDYASIIERRDGSGRMRLGVADCTIRRL